MSDGECDVQWRLNEADRVTLKDMLRLVRGWTSSEAVMLDADRLLESLAEAPPVKKRDTIGYPHGE